MKLPPFHLDGRHVTVRWIDARGKRRVAGMRGSQAYVQVWLSNVIAGTGKDFEMRLSRGPWHRVEATFEEAREELSGGLFTRGLLAKALTTRRYREERGLEVL